jgi:hypothetical protein
MPLSESKRGEKRTSGYEFLSFLARRFESKFFMELTWNGRAFSNVPFSLPTAEPDAGRSTATQTPVASA